MLTVYVDDSGTHNEARVAAAACCVSSVSEWGTFNRKWREVECREAFRHFHMSAFAACRRDEWCRDCRDGKTSEEEHPWRSWSSNKRERVITKLVNIVYKYIQVGFGWAIIKEDYNDLVAPPLRDKTGEPYTYAFACCGGQIKKWRDYRKITQPMEYVFDLIPHKEKETQIATLFVRSLEYDPEAATKYGFTQTGYSFKNKKLVLPLLAADMLAWATVQELLHTSEIRLLESHESRIVCRMFEAAGDAHRKTFMGYQTREQLKEWVEKETALREKIGKLKG
jgi:hypothetical protein